MFKSYRDLQVWSLGMKIAKTIYQITEYFPKNEVYGLTNQLRRAAVSVPSNIAEGHVRSTKEFIHFLTIALGSVAEIETQIELSEMLGFVKTDISDLKKELDDIGKMIRGLQKSLASNL